MKNEESRIQQACIRWFRLQYPEHRLRLFAVPNGGKRDAVTGAILKAEGAVAGVADIIFLMPKGKYHGLCIEMKTEKGRQQDAQKAFEKAVTETGYLYTVCRSLQNFIELIKWYLNE